MEEIHQKKVLSSRLILPWRLHVQGTATTTTEAAQVVTATARAATSKRRVGSVRSHPDRPFLEIHR